MSLIYKNLHNLKGKKIENPLTLSKKYDEPAHRKRKKMLPKHMERNSSQATIKEVQIKIMLQYHFSPFRWQRPKGFLPHTYCWDGVGRYSHTPLVGMQSCRAPTEGTWVISSKTANVFILRPSNPTSRALSQRQTGKNANINIHKAVHCSAVHSAVHLVKELQCFNAGFIFDLEINPYQQKHTVPTTM